MDARRRGSVSGRSDWRTRTVVAGRPDAVSATSRTAVTPLAPNDGRPGEGAADTRGGTAVTAEIPAVPVAPAYGVLLPDGSIWYPGSKRKLPAPTFLRVIVWTLAFLVAILGAGLIVEHYHPSWLDPVRHVVGHAGPGLGCRSAGTLTTDAAASSTPVFEQDESRRRRRPNSVTYSVPGSPFMLSIRTTARCYVVVRSLATGADLFASTINAGATQSVARAERLGDGAGLRRRVVADGQRPRQAPRHSPRARVRRHLHLPADELVSAGRQAPIERRPEHRAPAAFLDPPRGELGPRRRQQPRARQGRRASAPRGGSRRPTRSPSISAAGRDR